MRMRDRFAGLVACVLVAACVAPASQDRVTPTIAVGGDSPLVEIFTRVAGDTGVPVELLATLAHIETRFQIAGDSHGSHYRGARGLLGLPPDDLIRGAQLAGVTDEAARSDAEANLRAGAALLRDAAPAARTLDDFVATLRPELRRQVTTALARGVDGRDRDGHSIVIAARPRLTGFGTTTQALGYPGAEWHPASTQNYDVANRDVGGISNIVIHTAQGSFSGTISWFQNPASGVSSHYVVRSDDGSVAQMVAEKNIAFHDKCFNTRTIGIEHEGKVEQPELWYTEAMYVESAKLTAYLCDKYGIAKERGAIVGHGDAPDCSDHTDPGDGWDWEHYIDLVRTGGAPMFAAGDVEVDAPASLVSGERGTVVVTLTNNGNTVWDLDLTRLGTSMPQDRESMFFVDGDWLSPNRATSTDVRVEPGETGSFTFDIVAPRVGEPLVFDEAFQLVEEGITWFGPDIHVMIQVIPESDSGCSTSGAGSPAVAGVMLALGVALRRRRRGSRRL